MSAVTQEAAPGTRSSGGRFWIGAGFGGALAASIAFALLSLTPILDERAGSATPELTIALNETREVAVAIDSPAALVNAQIRVSLSGAVALAGFEGQPEILWSADLDQGVNMLSLPVTMQGVSGGQVLVEVTHDEGHEIFVINLKSQPPHVGTLLPLEQSLGVLEGAAV